MAKAAVTDAEFVELFETVGPSQTALRVGTTLRNVYGRRRRIEDKIGRSLVAPTAEPRDDYPHRIRISVPDGIVLVGSDAHYWPGQPWVMHRAFVKFCKTMKPVAVIKNGDALDGASISRHTPIGWENRPKLIDEIEACKERLGEIEKAAFKAHKIWTLGNHDARFETRLASVAPEYAKVHGVHLADHFPLWQPAWSCFINDDVVVKHRFRSGMHAPHNNTLWAGRSIITGHMHSAKVQPITDYNGTRYGVDTGCLANPDGPQFVDYTEDNPKSWRSGFGVLTFRGGRLMQPELCLAVDADHVEFRGELHRV